MVRNNKTTLAKLLSLLLTVTLCFTVFTMPVSAESSDGSPEQKDEKTKLTFLEDVDPEEPEPAVVEPIYEYGTWNRVHSNPAVFEKKRHGRAGPGFRAREIFTKKIRIPPGKWIDFLPIFCYNISR